MDIADMDLAVDIVLVDRVLAELPVDVDCNSTLLSTLQYSDAAMLLHMLAETATYSSLIDDSLLFAQIAVRTSALSLVASTLFVPYRPLLALVSSP